MRISFIFGVACAVLNAHKTFAYLSINIHLVAQVLPRLLPGEQIALSQVVFPIVGGAVFLLWEGWYFLLWESFLAAAGKLPGSWHQAIYLAGGFKLPGRGLLGGDAVRHPLTPLELLQINPVIGWYCR